MSRKLDGKTAVLTGATAGIGLATAKRFVAEGARVFITGRRQEQLGRVGDLGDIAAAALFLASDDASFIAGTELFVDGGQAQI